MSTVNHDINTDISEYGYQFLQELPLSSLLEFKEHRRLTVFYNKGLKCSNPNCNRIGTRLIVGMQKQGALHVDVYTDDLVMMTVDHIHPKSKGGSECLENKQPMCSPCNSNKGSRTIPQKIIKFLVYSINE